MFVQMQSSVGPDGEIRLGNFTRAIYQLISLLIKIVLADYMLHYIYIFALTDHIDKLTSPTLVLLMSLIVIFDWTKCYFIYEIVRVLMARFNIL